MRNKYICYWRKSRKPKTSATEEKNTTATVESVEETKTTVTEEPVE